MKKLLIVALLALVSSAAFTATLNPVQLLNPTGSAAGQAIVSTGASTAPAWGNVTAAGLAAQAANTVVANATGSSASPAAFAMPSCSASGGALQWASGTGFTCVANAFASPPAIGSSTPAAGSFTTLSASGTVSGAGFSNYLAAPPVIGTTPNAGGFTSLFATGAFTPSQTFGIVGTTTNNNANAGSVGEYLTAATAGTSLTASASANVASISLTAGDWDVMGSVTVVPAGSTVVTFLAGGINTGSATLPVGNTGASFQISGSATAGVSVGAPTPMVRISLSTTTTVFLVANCAFTTSTLTASGFIRARRVR